MTLRQRKIIILVLIARSLIGFWLLYREQLPFIPISFDDYSRTLLAYRWDEWIGVWLPLPALLTGALMGVWPDYWVYAPLVVNTLASAAALWFLYALSLALFREFTPALLTILIVAVLPWPLWLSLSGLPNSLLQLWVMLGCWSLLRWLSTDRWGYLLWACLSLLLAELTRYEAWSLGLIIFGLVGYRLLRQSRHPFKKEWAVVSPLILLPGLWLALNYWQQGDALYFSNFVQARAIGGQGPGIGSGQLTLYLREMANVSRLILGLVLAGVGLHFWSKKGDHKSVGRLYLIAWLLWLMSLMLSSVLGNRPSHLPVRVVVTPLLLLAPWAGYALFCLTRSRLPFRLAAVSLVVVITSTLHLAQLRSYPLAITPELRIIAQGLKALWHEGFLDDTDQVLIERQAWDYLPLQVLSAHPGSVWVDRGPPAGLRVQMSPLVLAESSQTTEAELRSRRFKLVVVHSAAAVEQLRHFMLAEAQLDRYTIFVYPEDQSDFENTALITGLRPKF
ncbi:MAG TPA: glycosyltransferase family 39 protein [Anaerolineae bacterium]|jgi:hypothetical protein